MKPLRLALAPLMSGADIGDNIKKLTAYVRRAAGKNADLLLLPEAFLTGYQPSEAAVRALLAESEEIRAVIDLAGKYALTLSCGFMERSMERAEQTSGDPALYLTQLITDGSHTQFYRKTHLGCREQAVFSEGNDLPVFTGQKAVIGTHLCWESHIPDIASTLRGRGAELLLIPYASGLSGRTCRDVWSRHMPARSSDNGVYTAACNALSHRRMPEQNLSGCHLPDQSPADVYRSSFIGGGCAIYDPKGRLIASYFGLKERLLICDLDPDLPRCHPDGDMGHISYFDRRRPELYR